MRITAADVEPLALGCELLGSGGGGSTAAARLILSHHLATAPPVTLAARPAPTHQVICVGAVGAAALMLENLPGPTAFTRAVATMQRHAGPARALLPLEVGGVNGLLAVLTAATLRLPLLDADPMGRAYTRLHRTVLAGGTPMTAAAFSSTSGESAYFEATDAESVERMVRAILPSVGGWGAVAYAVGPARAVLAHAVRGTVSRALGLGAALQAAMAGDPGPLLSRDDVTSAFDGVVVEVTRRPGLEVGGVVSLRHRRMRRIVRLDFANEYVAAYENGVLIACAPDIVCVLDEETWRPIPVDRIAATQHVRLLLISAPRELAAAHRRTGDFGLTAHGFAPVGSQR